MHTFIICFNSFLKLEQRININYSNLFFNSTNIHTFVSLYNLFLFKNYVIYTFKAPGDIYNVFIILKKKK